MIAGDSLRLDEGEPSDRGGGGEDAGEKERGSRARVGEGVSRVRTTLILVAWGWESNIS